jgi:hypothetical protein
VSDRQFVVLRAVAQHFQELLQAARLCDVAREVLGSLVVEVVVGRNAAHRRRMDLRLVLAVRRYQRAKRINNNTINKTTKT